MNILILTDYYPPDKLGGVGEIAKNLKLSYDAKGHKTWVLTTGESSGEPKVVRSSKSLIKGVLLNNYHAVKMIRRYKIQMVNAHQSTTTLFLLTKYVPFLYPNGFPKVVNSFQVSYFSEFSNIRSIKVRGRTFKPTQKEYIEKWVLAPMHIFLDWIGYTFSNVITVVSSENQKEFRNTYGRLSRKKIHIIPNGIQSSDFAPKKPDLPKSYLSKLEGKTVLLYVGVFRVRKRVFNLLFALAETAKENPDVILVLVGGGRDYEDEIMSLVDELGIKKNVLFVGRVPNEQVVDYLNSADVFCLLSSYEGMPIAILEAMSSGKAVLTSRVSGMIDLVEDGKTGYLTEVDDLDEITKRLKQLVNDPALTKQLGEAGRKRIEDQYDWSDVADAYIKIFKS